MFIPAGCNSTPRANRFWRRTAPCRQPPKAASPGWPPWAQYGPATGGYLAYQPYSRVSVAAWSTRSNSMSRVACAKRAIIPAAHRVHSDHSLSSLEDLAYSKSRHLMCFLVCSASTASTGASRYDHALRFMMVGGIVSGAGQIKLHKEAAEMLQRCVHAFA
jgi:hypothetical protein